MEKINLFVILAFKEQTYKYLNLVEIMEKRFKTNEKRMETTLSYHFFMLSKYFNLYNLYEYEEKVESFDNAVIYHLPFGKDNISTGVEDLLMKFKGKVPIVMRSYDAHSPLKTSKEYMEKYHDVIFTYLTKHVNNSNILFENMSYDNNLVYLYKVTPKKRKLVCMVLRKETRPEYYESSEKFKEKDLNLRKIYDLRINYAQDLRVDVYGRNWPARMENYKGTLNPHFKKYSVLNEYKFNLITENVIVDNFLSEKILDSFISLSVPVYLGSPTVHEWIPKSCYIDIRDFNTNEELFDFLERMSAHDYDNYIGNILNNRSRLFDIFSTKNNFAIPLYEWYGETYNIEFESKGVIFEGINSEIESLTFNDDIDAKEKVKNFLRLMKLKLNSILKR